MKFVIRSFSFLLLYLTLLSISRCSEINQDSAIKHLESYHYLVSQAEIVRKEITDKKITRTHLIVSLETSQGLLRFPFIGKYVTTIKCDEFKSMLTYHILLRKFKEFLIKCSGYFKVVNEMGELSLHFDEGSEDFGRMNDDSKNSSFSITTELLDQEDTRKFPKWLKHFFVSLVPYNFDPEIDQNYKFPSVTPIFKGIISNSDLRLIPISFSNGDQSENFKTDELTFAMFESPESSYAIPIRSYSFCNYKPFYSTLNCLVGYKFISYNLIKGLLTHKNIEILTTNIRGFRVIISSSFDEVMKTAKTELENSKKNGIETLKLKYPSVGNLGTKND
ncbi:hypothetical protein HWI79_1885 [Cryptosporidium felis]|nr:hypothetical protein HWI79_1885 [Cryptosporidium felis]